MLIITNHYRDWLAVMSTLGIINEFTDHAYAFQNMLDRVEWLIVPVSNPDGYVYSHTTVSSSLS